MKFGTLYPVYCQPVIPGDSFSIETAFNLKLLPVVFPVQTKMRAHMHFFYVRNKNLWSNWENWISNLVAQSEHPHPYISVPDNEFKSGSIHDFMGVPTSLVSKSSFQLPFSTSSEETELPAALLYHYTYNEVLTLIENHSAFSNGTFTSNDLMFLRTFEGDGGSQDVRHMFRKHNVITEVNDLNDYCAQLGTRTLQSPYICFMNQSGRNTYPLAIVELLYDDDNHYYYFDLTQSQLDVINSSASEVWFDFAIQFSNNVVVEPTSVTPLSIKYEFVSQGSAEYSDLNLGLYSNNLHINALPYRAYESIYYCYYNNNVLHPLTIGGQVQYNRYNTNLGDGADTTNYHLFQRNYELDFLTSALPSPQQGVAPLVGMTALGDITIEDENGITTAHADIDNDGTITKVVLTSPAASNEHARMAMNMASCGMSINDFRQTNALQRMLETNIRKGYRYMDFIAGHFGKEPEYRELDLPEFIGGFSRDVSVSTVVSNADTLSEGSPFGAALGEYGGYAQVVGGSNHAVRHYCDDFGYIIGILSVVPTPCYSQLLPKHMIAPDNFLDYPFPEFMQSGLMPITYKEVAPIQSYIDSLSDSDKRLEDTFGYQRPNYDLVSAVDEVHGEFRNSLKDYVINRIFDTRPELGQDFISINPDEINDIFVNRNPDEDTIIGEIGFSVHAKRPVPRVVIPNLGR